VQLHIEKRGEVTHPENASQDSSLMSKRIQLRRSVPDEQLLAWRKGYLSALRHIYPQRKSSESPRGLSPGNSKTGATGEIFKSVFLWNLPAVASCPGASEWCLTHCYNADDRPDVFPVEEWAENWFWVEERPDVLSKHIIQQLTCATPPVAVRIHSSGDFYSEQYIAFWRRIIEALPDVSFWAYTRSWVRQDLRLALEQLRMAKNMQLFASVDHTMPAPPAEWRLAVVFNGRLEPRIASEMPELPCPEQVEGGPNCANCGFCIRGGNRGVAFAIH
jgi:Gene product 88